MKLGLGSLLGSSKKKKKTRSVSRSGNPYFGSSSSLSSDCSAGRATPVSVLPDISRRELEAVLRRLGPDPPTDAEVEAMLAEADRRGDGCISLEEIALLGGSTPGQHELWAAFAAFDADGDGLISAEELLGMLVGLGDQRCTLEECRRMISGVDSDGDGHVGFEDFVRMMDGQL